jgi:ribulose-phosphate 3-epimerase
MIVPALLTDKKEELIAMASDCAKFTDFVQIDIMDGEFVPSRSVTRVDLAGWRCPVRCEAHLMVKEPLSWVDAFKAVGAERIVYHFEVEADHFSIINQIRSSGLGVGLALNPETDLREFRFLASALDCVLFLSVNPGFYGAAFLPEVLDKVKRFKAEFPAVQAGVDGGIKLDNVRQAKASGADYLCVGSAILQAADRRSVYEDFVRLIHV